MDKLAVVIVCPYQHLVEQWVEDIVRFNMKPIIGYSSSPQKDWKSRLSKAVRDQKIRDDKSFFALYVLMPLLQTTLSKNRSAKLERRFFWLLMKRTTLVPHHILVY